jgi:hypothetical protein
MDSILMGSLRDLRVQNQFFEDWKFNTSWIEASPDNRMHEGKAWTLEKRVGGFLSEHRRFGVTIFVTASKMEWFRTRSVAYLFGAEAWIFEYPDSGPLFPRRGYSSYERELADIEVPSSITNALGMVTRVVFG